MADKIVVMRDGVVEQIGSPLEVYDRPANLFVAGFIGSPAMNFMPGVLQALRRRCAGRVCRRHLRCPCRPAQAARTASRSIYGTRPEHIALAAGDDGVPSEVVVVEPTGADTQVFTKIAGMEVATVFRDRHAFRPGRNDPPAARPGARPFVRRRQRRAADALNSAAASKRPALFRPNPRRQPCPTTTGESSSRKHRPRQRPSPFPCCGPARAQAQWSNQPEKGAKLRVLRWKRFVQGDEDQYMANVKKFTETDRHRSAGRQRKLGRRASQGGGGGERRRRSGHHPVDQRRREPVSGQAGRRHRPGQLPRQEVRRLVSGLRAVPAGPTARNGSACRWAAPATAIVYRESQVKAAGFDSFPKDTDRLPQAHEGAQGKGHAGRLRAGARQRRPGAGRTGWSGPSAASWSTKRTRS